MPLIPAHLRPHSAWLGAALLCASLLSGAALAQTSAPAPYTEVQRLLNTGEPAQAMKMAESYLADHPKDPQIRFLIGVIQSQQGHNDQAQATYTQLMQDYPELPEPYNNLAVLYASQGQLERAREALESAVRLNPNYATAFHNLGDVYAQMAQRAYSRALTLDANEFALPERIKTLQQMLGTASPVR